MIDFYIQAFICLGEINIVMERLFTAIPTPFLNGNIDYQSLENLIVNQIKNKVDGIVLSGSTGEGHALSKDEWISLMQFGIKFQDKISIVAGVGFNITTNAVEYAKLAEKIGVKYILATTPYYNKPQQEGLYQHFKAICDVVKNTKIILYNVPGRTVTDLKNETIVRLVQDLPQIVALKDATGKLERVCELKAKLQNIRPDFIMLSGEDATQIGFNAMGGNGVISVVSNIAPKLCKEIQDLCANNDYQSALKLQNNLFNLSNAMFCESNPVPVKYALYKLGIFRSQECRLPLVELMENSKKIVDKCLSI